jgi:hypothetical protein
MPLAPARERREAREALKQRDTFEEWLDANPSMVPVAVSVLAEMRERDDWGYFDFEDGDDPTRHWTFENVLEVAGEAVEPPQVCGLCYLGQRHVVSGEADKGKTWLMLWVAAEEIKAGHAVAWFNTDDMPPRELLERLVLLGCTREQVGELFLYAAPDVKASADEVAALVARAVDAGARLAVVDSFNSTMMIEGLDPLKTAEVEVFWRRIASPLCRAGLAFVAIDHVPKSDENRGRYSFGAERKLSGTHVHIGMQGAGFSRDEGGGRVRLYTHKDRTGYLPKPILGDFTLEVVGPLASGAIVPVDSEAETAANAQRVMVRVSEYLEGEYPSSAGMNNIEKHVTGNAAEIREATAELVAGGWVERQASGQSRMHTCRFYFRAGDVEPLPSQDMGRHKGALEGVERDDSTAS